MTPQSFDRNGLTRGTSVRPGVRRAGERASQSVTSSDRAILQTTTTQRPRLLSKRKKLSIVYFKPLIYRILNLSIMGDITNVASALNPGGVSLPGAAASAAASSTPALPSTTATAATGSSGGVGAFRAPTADEIAAYLATAVGGTVSPVKTSTTNRVCLRPGRVCVLHHQYLLGYVGASQFHSYRNHRSPPSKPLRPSPTRFNLRAHRSSHYRHSFLYPDHCDWQQERGRPRHQGGGLSGIGS